MSKNANEFSIKHRQALIDAATASMNNAYAPYSNFKVGAAILAEDGNIYSGCNVENAAYPMGCCAEASAISAMINNRQLKILAVAVTGASNELCTPCGGCRQRIREFAEPETPIFICDADGLRHTATLAELLPMSFGPDNLS